MRKRIALLMLLVLGLASAAESGVIRGTVRLPAPPAPKRAAHGKKSRTVRTVAARAPDAPRGTVLDAVIYVEQVPSAADSAAAAADSVPATLSQYHQAFVPRVLPVAAGTEVRLPNLDPVYHDVFSLSPIKNFELGRYPQGESRRVVFDRPGLVNVYCSLHSRMAAFVLVLPHHVFARPDSSGAFRLPNLPAGSYTVCVWHPDMRGLRRDVQVPDSTDVVLDLSL